MRRFLGIAVALILSLDAWAQSPPGNELNPAGLDNWRVVDERGMTLLQKYRRRSPSGLLYPFPQAPAPTSALGGGWTYGGTLQLGTLWDGGGEDEARFERYTEWTDEAFANALSLSVANAEQGYYLDFRSGAIGRDDQFYSLDAGRFGSFRLRGSFTRIPHLFANDAQALFLGEGGDSLRLPSSLTPGDNTEAEIDEALLATPESSLELKRDRSRLRLDFKPLSELNLFASYEFEDRDGSRAFGGALSIPPVGATTGGVVETVEPIDHRTQNFSAGLEYGGKSLQANLVYNGSFFRNDNRALTWENPFTVTPVPGRVIERGRFAVAPDNEYHNLKGDLAVPLPWRSRFTGTVSWGTMRQDEDLLPPTVNSVFLPGIGPFSIDLSEWNTTAALSQDSANADIDTLLLNASLRTNFWKPLRLEARYRYYDQDNDTRYLAFNPLTGEYGYIVTDGGQGALSFRQGGVYFPALQGGKWRYRNTPFRYKKLQYQFRASYRAARKTTLALRLERDVVERDFRERDRMSDDRIRASVTSRDLSWATIRLSYEYGDRDGSSFDLNVSDPFFTSSLPGYIPPAAGDNPPGLPGLRTPNLSDRREQIIDGRVNFLIGNDMDLVVGARFQDDDYHTDYGLTRQRELSLNLEWSFQPSPERNAHVFATLERGRQDVDSIFGEDAGSDPSLAYPDANAWSADSETSALTLGAGFSVRLARGFSLESDYIYSYAHDELDYGTRFTILRSQDHIVETRLRWQVSETLALRFYHRYQRSTRDDDWEQTGLVPRSDHRLFFAHIDNDYQASVYGIALQKRF
jgi:MtrB/PioB family decaheme-associated outer membrane protein